MVEINLKCLRRIAEIPVLLSFFGCLLTGKKTYRHLEYVALIIAAYCFLAPISTNFVIYRICYTSLGFDREECAKLGTNDADNRTQEIEDEVQPYANVMMMSQSVLTQIVPSLLCLFLGPWSDKNGRKPIMIMTTLGNDWNEYGVDSRIKNARFDVIC